jgi:hypothetical protein
MRPRDPTALKLKHLGMKRTEGRTAKANNFGSGYVPPDVCGSISGRWSGVHARIFIVCSAAAVLLANGTLHPQRRPLPANSEADMQRIASKFADRSGSQELERRLVIWF